MDRREGVHTVPAPDGRTGWWNMLDGEVLSRHKVKDQAVEAGRAAAEALGETHTVQDSEHSPR